MEFGHKYDILAAKVENSVPGLYLVGRTPNPTAHACTLDRFGHDLLWSRLRPGQSLFVVRVEDERLVQHAAQEVQFAPQAAVHLSQGQRDRDSRGDRQGLRVR